jgi:hypothetical protein
MLRREMRENVVKSYFSALPWEHKKELYPVNCFEKGCLQKKKKAHNSS